MKVFTKRIVQLYDKRSENSIVLSRLSSVLGIDILVKASGFLLLPFYLMLMTQSEFGLYNYILSIIQTFSLVLNLGLYIPISKYYHSHPDQSDRGRLLFTVFTALSVFILALLIPLYAFRLDYRIIELLFNTSIDYEKYRNLILMALVVSTLSFTLNSYFFTSEKIRQIKTYNICRIVLINLVSISALYYFKADTVGTRLLFTYAGELILLTVFAFILVKEMIPVFKIKLLQSSLKLGLPVMISAIFGIVVNFGDKFFLEKYGTLKDLSNYYLAISFASIIPLIFASFQNVWLPIFMKEKDVQKNYQKTKKIIFRLTLLFFVLGVVIWVGFQALLWIHLIPKKYYAVTYILPILLITQVIAAIVPLLSNYFIYFEKTKIVSIAGLVVSIVSLLLGILLIPPLKTYGAALTALFSNMLYLLIYYYTVLRVNKKHLQTVYSI